MADTIDSARRSWVMSRIRGKDTRPERFIRSLLHGLGYRFTVNGPRNRKLPGRPDIVLPKHHAIVFVHGCFWHGHRGCKHHRIPKTRAAWWRTKIEGNRARDARNRIALEALGWRVLVLWTCEFDTVPKKEAMAALLPDLIEGGAVEEERIVAEDQGRYGTSA